MVASHKISQLTRFLQLFLWLLYYKYVKLCKRTDNSTQPTIYNMISLTKSKYFIIFVWKHEWKMYSKNTTIPEMCHHPSYEIIFAVANALSKAMCTINNGVLICLIHSTIGRTKCNLGRWRLFLPDKTALGHLLL